MKIKEYIFEKDGEMFIEFLNTSKVKVRDFLNINEYNIQKRLGEYPSDLEKIMSLETEAEFQEGLFELRKKEIQYELDYCEANIAQQIRNGIRDIGHKITESSIKEAVISSTEYQDIIEKIKSISKKILKTKKIKNMVSCLSRAMKDMKDCLITYSANLRSENTINMSNVERTLKNINKGEM